ncbi:type II toxin-antitoxin system PemK/MazF family toxin [Candidatus Peregrinibacteria bacterium]|nr:type II toxin-antitoxin system PemK/MazF family toxin [Candidatus Peregrinibacteria bacterium]MBI3816844.1 type II toxin-antitoxin system PemK/MazF family toxin [Candidatus Peregrinibacteria bacterium]
MQKLFDQWNSMKKKLDAQEDKRTVFFHEREVWWCSIGINVGVESDGKNDHFERPVLIVKKFNGYMLWVIPLTSKKRFGKHYHRIAHDRGVSFACLSQLRTISSKRLLRKIGMISTKEFTSVRACIASYIKSDPA